MSKHLVQLQIIGNKINEYFSLNPKAVFAIFEASLGKEKAKLRVEKKNKSLEIVEIQVNNKRFLLKEGPAAKVLNQKQASLEQSASQLQQAIANIQAAQAPSQASEPPVPPAPAGPSAGPSMQPVGMASPPLGMMPPMAASAPAMPPMGVGGMGVPPTSMPPPTMPAPGSAPVAPSAPSLSEPPPGEGLPPEPEPLPAAPHEPGGNLDPGAVALPPGMAQGGIDADELGDLHRMIQKKDPGGYEQEFGAVALGNGNVPPDIPAGTLPPEEPKKEEEAYQLQEIDPMMRPETFPQMQQDYERAITTFPLNQSQIGQTMQKITTGLSGLQGTERDTAADMLATLAGAQEQDPNKLSLAHKSRGKNIIKEDDLSGKKDLADLAPFQPGTSEESALVRGLKGQTVQDVSVENDEKSVKIQLTLATTKWPVIFEFTQGGKVTYTFKDRRYVLVKSWRGN